MLLPQIDLNKKIQVPKLYVCKPDKTVVTRLKEAYNIVYHPKLGNISELTFDVPYYLEQNHQLLYNKHIDLCIERYLIKFVMGNLIEYHLINQVTNHMNSEQEEGKQIHAYSLGYELRDKNIYNYQSMVTVNGQLIVGSINATTVLTNVLANTLWTIGTIDATFDITYRQFNITSKTVLEALYEISTTFSAIIIFDTINRTISLQQLNNVGINRGLTVSYGQLLRTLDHTSNVDEIVTQLKPFGKNGLSIAGVNPTGGDILENFSFFLDNFAQDSNGIVLSHSRYMSDGLCKAILAYNILIASNQSNYTTLLSQLTVLQTTLTTQQNDLANLNTTLKTIQQNIDTAQTTGANVNGYPASYWLTQQTLQKALIASKQSDINATNVSITNKLAQITVLNNTLSITNNFTSGQIAERKSFEIEKIWVDTNYTNAQDLYNAGIQHFNTLKNPQLISKIDLVNFLEVIEEQNKWQKLNLGDIINISYKAVNVNFQAKIVEMNFSFEDGNVTLTIANVQNILTDLQKWIQSLNSAVSTSTSVNMNQYKYESAYTTSNTVQQTLNSAWDSAKQQINSGLNNSVVNDRRGITITDSVNSNRFIRMTNGVLGLTADGGNTFSTAITADGVYAQRLIGQIIAGVNLTITNTSGTFTFDQNGATIAGASLTITGGLPSTQLSSGVNSSLSLANNSLQINNTYSNGIRMDSTEGIVVTRSDNKVRTKLNATTSDLDGIAGFKIQTSTDNGITWNNKIYVDTSGNLNLSGNIVSGSDILLNTSTKTFDLSKFTTILGQITSANINSTNLHVSSANIDGTITANSLVANASITSPTINGGNINGSIISASNSFNVASNVWNGNPTQYGMIFGGTVAGRVNPASIKYYQGTGSGDSFMYYNLPSNAWHNFTGGMVEMNCPLSVTDNVTITGGQLNMNYGCYVEALSDGFRLHFNASNYFYIGTSGAYAVVNNVWTKLG